MTKTGKKAGTLVEKRISSARSTIATMVANMAPMGVSTPDNIFMIVSGDTTPLVGVEESEPQHPPFSSKPL